MSERARSTSSRSDRYKMHAVPHAASYYENRCIVCDSFDRPSELTKVYKRGKCHAPCYSGVRSYDRVLEQGSAAFKTEIDDMFDRDLTAWQNKVKFKRTCSFSLSWELANHHVHCHYHFQNMMFAIMFIVIIDKSSCSTCYVCHHVHFHHHGSWQVPGDLLV